MVWNIFIFLNLILWLTISCEQSAFLSTARLEECSSVIIIVPISISFFIKLVIVVIWRIGTNFISMRSVSCYISHTNEVRPSLVFVIKGWWRRDKLPLKIAVSSICMSCYSLSIIFSYFSTQLDMYLNTFILSFWNVNLEISQSFITLLT